MDTISNIVLSLVQNQSSIYVVERYITGDGRYQFNVDTLDKHITHSYNSLRNKKAPRYHLLGFADSIDTAHDMIIQFEKQISPAH